MIRLVVSLAQWGCLSLLISTALAQQPGVRPPAGKGKITGHVVDAATKEGLEYATITLFRNLQAPPLNGTLTDGNGNFELAGLGMGNYTLVVFSLGYQPDTLQKVLTEQVSVLNLGDLGLQNKSVQLKGVTIVGEKAVIENRIDKIVYNVDKDLTSQGGVATDVLKKVPQVSVDVDGNVEVQGNANIRFLINGKPSSIFGNSVSDALKAIPASQIASIEVITNPGARYDAEGSGGIINIILKQVKVEGISGNMSLSAGSRLENASLNIGAKKGPLAINGFFSGNALVNSPTINNLNRSSFDPFSQNSTLLLQNGVSRDLRHGFQSGSNLEWKPDTSNTLTASVGFAQFGFSSSGLINQQLQATSLSGQLLSDSSLARNTSNAFLTQSLDWSAGYQRSFTKPDQLLSVLVSQTNGLRHIDYSQSQQLAGSDVPFAAARGTNPALDRETNLQADYIQPISKVVKLSLGAKTVLRRINSTTYVNSLNLLTGNYNYDPHQSNQFIYNRNIYAGYLEGNFTFAEKWSLRAGGRFEHTEVDASSNNAPLNIKPNNFFSPSVILARQLANNQSVKVSYNRRIQRPDFRRVNPFTSAQDPRNLTQGNPRLLPEIEDVYEAAYSKSFEKGGVVNASLFYRNTSNDLLQYIVYYPSYAVGDTSYANVSVNTWQNVGKEYDYGTNLFGSLPVSKQFTLRSNVSIFNRKIVNQLVGGSISGVMYRLNLNLTYRLADVYAIEAFANYNSRNVNAQGSTAPFFSYNFAFRKQIFHKKGSIAFVTTNPFNQYVNQPSHQAGPDFVLNSTRRVSYNSYGINFTYNFGSLKFKKTGSEGGDSGPVLDQP